MKMEERRAKAEDYETEQKKQAAADVLFSYSTFVMTCIGNQVRPCDLRMHLIKEISGMPTSLKKESSQNATSPEAGTSSSGMRIDKNDNFRALLS